MDTLLKIWKDPVWSKVIATFIAYLIASIYGFIKGKKTSSFNPLISIPLLLKSLLKLLAYPVRKEIFFDFLSGNKIKLSDIISGEWRLIYVRSRQGLPEERGNERVLIKKNFYFSNDANNIKKKSFELKNISINLLTNEIVFTKFNIHEIKKHSTETLKIINKDTVQGTDDKGFTLTYTRVDKNERIFK